MEDQRIVEDRDVQHDGPTRAQQNVLLCLYEGWRLRFDHEFRWSLIQPGRDRVFCKVRSRTVQEMTQLGWLTPGAQRVGMGLRPAKQLTDAGKSVAQELLIEEAATRHRDRRDLRMTLVTAIDESRRQPA